MMFFFGGTRVRHKTIGESHQACPTCGVVRPHRRARAGNYLHLYWLPLFRVEDLGEVVICRHCGLSRTVDELRGLTGEDRDRSRQSTGDGTWTCPYCQNVNRAQESRCLRCQRRR